MTMKKAEELPGVRDETDGQEVEMVTNELGMLSDAPEETDSRDKENREALEAAGLDPDEVIDKGQALIRRLLSEQLGTLCSPAGGIARHPVHKADRLNKGYSPESAQGSNPRRLSDELGLELAESVRVVLAIEPCLRVERAEFDRVVSELNELSEKPRIDVLHGDRAAREPLTGGDSLFVGVLGWNRCGLPSAVATANTPTGHPCSGAVATWSELGYPPALFLHRIGTAQCRDAELQDEMLEVDEYIRDHSHGVPAVVRMFSDGEEFSRLIRGALAPEPTDGREETLIRSPSDDELLTENLRRVEARIARDGALVREVLQPLDESSSEALGAASRRLDALYSELVETSQWVESAVRDSASLLTERLALALKGLDDAEVRFWRELTDLLDTPDDAWGESIAALLTAFSGRRSMLRSSLLRCREAATSKATGQRGDDEFFAAVRSFLDTDELNVETGWRDLIRRGPAKLQLVLAGADGGDPSAIRLRQRVWRLLDFVIVEDLASLGRQRCPDDLTELRTFHLLVVNSGEDRRFGAVWRALQEGVVPKPELCEAAFLRSDVDASARDLGVMLRVLLIAARNDAERDLAARHIAMASLWSVVAYNQAPWKVLETICRRIRVGESDRYGKAFFDAIHSRLRDAVRTGATEETREDLADLVLELFRFDFFVETGYFERIERLVEALPRTDDVMKNPRLRLFSLRRTHDDAPRKQPPRDRRAYNPLDDLPLGVHRYLAGEPSRIRQYIGHEDPRIADMAAGNVSRENLLKVLQDRRIHRIILHKILQRRDLFISTATIVAALKHPKCTKRFALDHLRSIPDDQARKLAWSHEVNSDVKSVASAQIHRRSSITQQPRTFGGHKRGFGA